MNITDIIATHRTELLRNNSVGNSGHVDSSSADDSSPETREAGDRVEISDDARSALKDARKSEDLTFARKALNGVPQMTEDRIAELTDRIKSGYYQQADVIDQIAGRAGDELAAGK